MTVTLTPDVLVAGLGLGGCAAALAAARGGATVLLAGGGGRVGGQVSAQLVSALDEHPTVEAFPGTAGYGRYRALLRAASGGVDNPGGGWVSRLCVTPGTAESVLRDLLSEAGVGLVDDAAVASVEVRHGRVSGALLEDGSRVTPRVVLDATELGDLLPLTGTPYVTGSEGPVFGESDALPAADPRAMQSFTWCATLEHLPRRELEPVPRPRDYERWRHLYSLDVAGWDGTRHRYRMFEDGPDGRPPFWTYRRLAREPDGIVLNWVSNDYADASLVHDPERAARESRAQTLGFVHWLQTEAPRDDGGHGHHGIRLAPELSGTTDGLAAEPYARESRRLRSPNPFSGKDIVPIPGRARATPVRDPVAVAHYHADLHPRVGAPRTVYTETAPFQLPLDALLAGPAGGPTNLVLAGKGIGGTQVAAAAYRVHSGEWAIGEAAGTLAALAVRRRVDPDTVAAGPARARTLRRELVQGGVALAWTTDVPPGDPDSAAVQLLAAAGGLAGDRLATLDVRPDGPVDDADRQALHRAAEDVAGRPVPPAPDRGGHDTWRDLVRHHGTALGLTRGSTTTDRSAS